MIQANPDTVMIEICKILPAYVSKPLVLLSLRKFCSFTVITFDNRKNDFLSLPSLLEQPITAQLVGIVWPIQDNDYEYNQQQWI